MNWEELNDRDFAAAAKRTNLCVLPIGVMERHGNHLPLGTDMIAAYAIATLAAQREEAVVFPPTTSARSTRPGISLAPSPSSTR